MEHILELKDERALMRGALNIDIIQEAYRKDAWKPYDGVFRSNDGLEVDNFEEYNRLTKGEKNIVKMLLTDNFNEGVKTEESRHNRYYTMCVEYINFTPSSKDSRRNAKNKIETLSSERNEYLKRLANDIVDYGVKRPEHIVDIYNIDYEYILNEVNKVRPMEMDELKLILFGLKELSQNGLVSLSKSLLTGMFTSHHYKGIMNVLTSSGMLKLNRKYRKYYHPNRYQVNLTKILSEEITENKTLNRLRNIEIERDRYSDKEKLQMLKQSNPELPIIKDLELMIKAKEYVSRDGDKEVLTEENKWLAEEATEFTCAIYNYNQPKYDLDVLSELESKPQMLDIFAEYYYINLSHWIEYGTRYVPFNKDKTFLDYLAEITFVAA